MHTFFLPKSISSSSSSSAAGVSSAAGSLGFFFCTNQKGQYELQSHPFKLQPFYVYWPWPRVPSSSWRSLALDHHRPRRQRRVQEQPPQPHPRPWASSSASRVRKAARESARRLQVAQRCEVARRAAVTNLLLLGEVEFFVTPVKRVEFRACE
eukprot:scaffold107485_cov33-Tisochrysis_lutea.AAC.2